MRNVRKVFHHIGAIIPGRLACVPQTEPLYRWFHSIKVLVLF